MGVSVLVAVLVTDVGENRSVGAVVVDVDTLVEPRLFRLESGFCVVADVDEAVGTFDFDVADFHFSVGLCAVLDGVLGRTVAGLQRVFQRNLENASVKPWSAKVRNTVKVLAAHYREVVPKGFFGNLDTFD